MSQQHHQQPPSQTEQASVSSAVEGASDSSISSSSDHGSGISRKRRKVKLQLKVGAAAAAVTKTAAAPDGDDSSGTSEFCPNGEEASDDEVSETVEATAGLLADPGPRISEATPAAPATTTEEQERLMERWRASGDKEKMLRLLKQYHSAALYEWDVRDMRFARSTTPQPQPPRNNLELLGTYDILFVHGEPHGTDQGYKGGCISRTTPGNSSGSGSTLSIFQKIIPDDSD